MTLRPRSEVSAIARHLAGLKQARWATSTCRWWPDYLFHCTDIRNVVDILRSGQLLSRSEVTQSNRLAVDIASPQVISQTDTTWYEYVRLYFRPRTPTQFRNEGFRPVGQRELDSHCPVPVYLLFRALPILSRTDCLFTEGNLARRGTKPVSGVAALIDLPFELVYHHTSIEPDLVEKIRYHRNAEVLVQRQLSLDSLEMVACRSQAEYQTLLHLLPPLTLNRWVDKIGVLPDLGLFHNRWSFVEQAYLTRERMLFRFSKESETPGPFVARLELIDSSTGERHSKQINDFFANDVLHIDLPIVEPQDYTVSLLLDNQLAYAGRYQEDYLPF